ncbi:hypothetical protein, partial [Micromonospora sp. NPDC005324]|uniref:hypothetical protein n=1 Tax=Micromonospora sp. NPDC005324 TaxID=3157033 RepID=UPI0033BE937F
MAQSYQRLGMIPSFKEFARAAAVDLRGLTDIELEVFYFRYGEVVDEIVEKARNDPSLPLSLGALNQFLAEDVIASHLGDEWVAKNVISPDSSDLTRSYLGMEGPSTPAGDPFGSVVACGFVRGQQAATGESHGLC